jgi:hypothetical protein
MGGTIRLPNDFMIASFKPLSTRRWQRDVILMVILFTRRLESVARLMVLPATSLANEANLQA